MDANEMNIASYVRSLRSAHRSPRTIQSYVEAIEQLAEHHGGVDVTSLGQEAVEEYLIAVLEQHKATTAGNRFRSLRAFFNWAVREDILDRSPMVRLSEPTPTDKPIPVLGDDQIRALLKTCSGSDFESRRDHAVIRLWCEPGSPRLAEMTTIKVDDLDLRHDQVTIHGKGDRVRIVPFGAKTGQALDRYLRQRSKHKKTKLPELWIGIRGALTPSGLTQMLRRRATQAGIDHMHPHQLRHTAAHVWADSGGSEADAMVLFGWRSAEMPRRYGRSAAVERAQRAARRISPADRF